MRRSDILTTLHRSLVDLEIEIVDHTDPYLVGRRGRIVEESRRMLIIREGSTTIHVAKLSGRFKLIHDLGSFTIDGKLLEGDAKRRSKRKMRHW